MDKLLNLLESRNLKNLDDMDFLLQLSDLLRGLIVNRDYKHINKLINCTIDIGCSQAFIWIMEILQEEFDKKEKCNLESFTCEIGKSIKYYDKFVSILNVDFNSVENRIKSECDSSNEAQSFFNISKYRTAYSNIFLTSYENFDTKDNDYIKYELLFTGDIR